MGKTVLIVDDSSTMRKIIMRGLRQAGFEIENFLEASDGAEGMQRISNADVDLVLSDVNMPNVNGMEFLKALQSHDPRPPVVMITTEGNDDVIAEAMQCGANGYLRKPFTPEKMQRVIGPFLERKQ